MCYFNVAAAFFSVRSARRMARMATGIVRTRTAIRNRTRIKPFSAIAAPKLRMMEHVYR